MSHCFLIVARDDQPSDAIWSGEKTLLSLRLGTVNGGKRHSASLKCDLQSIKLADDHVIFQVVKVGLLTRGPQRLLFGSDQRSVGGAEPVLRTCLGPISARR